MEGICGWPEMSFQIAAKVLLYQIPIDYEKRELRPWTILRKVLTQGLS